MSRSHNPERAKLYLNYSVLEIAALFDVNKTTVSHWISAGLTPIDRKRPLLVTGVELRAFIKKRMAAMKRPSAPGEIFCIACKWPKAPIDARVDFQKVSATSGNIVGECPDCGLRIFRRVSLANMARDCGPLVVRFTDRAAHHNSAT